MIFVCFSYFYQQILSEIKPRLLTEIERCLTEIDAFYSAGNSRDQSVYTGTAGIRERVGVKWSCCITNPACVCVFNCGRHANNMLLLLVKLVVQTSLVD